MARPKKVVTPTTDEQINEIRKVLDELSKKVDKLTKDVKDINDDLNYIDEEINTNTKKEDTKVSIEDIDSLLQAVMFLEFSNSYNRRHNLYRLFF